MIAIRKNILCLACKIRKLPWEENDPFFNPSVVRIDLNMWCGLVNQFTLTHRDTYLGNELMEEYVRGNIGKGIPNKVPETLHYAGFTLTNSPSKNLIDRFRSRLASRPAFKKGSVMAEAIRHDSVVYDRSEIWTFIKDGKIVDYEMLLISGTGACIYGGGLDYNYETALCSSLIEKFALENRGMTRLYRIYEYEDGKYVTCYEHSDKKTKHGKKYIAPVTIEPTDDLKYIKRVYDLNWTKATSIEEIQELTKWKLA